MVKPDTEMKNDRPVGEPRRRPQEAATATIQDLPSAAAAASEAVQQGAEAAGTVTVDALRNWTDGILGLPVRVLAGEDVGPWLSGRAWLDGTFETVAALMTVQRRSVDRFLQVQHRIAAQLVDSGWTLAMAAGSAGARRGEDER